MDGSILISIEGRGRLPTFFDGESPVFTWELPEGTEQYAYRLELRAAQEHTLSDGTDGTSYYDSSIVTDAERRHETAYALSGSSWEGLVEVRLRIYDENYDVVCSTHGFTSSDVYPFEPVRQWRKWGDGDDRLYFVVDGEVEAVSGTFSPVLSFGAVYDEDKHGIEYEAQVSLSPLFGECVSAKAVADGAVVKCVAENPPEGVLYHRTRAFDGYDYGDWSYVGAFRFTPSLPPACRFSYVEAGCDETESNIMLRPNGEVEFAFVVEDGDSETVSASVEFVEDGVAKPCLLSAPAIAVPVGEEVKLTWISGIELKGTHVVALRVVASDGVNESEAVMSDSFVVNNTGAGQGGTPSVYLSHRVCGNAAGYVETVVLPETRTEMSGGVPRPKELPEREDGDWTGDGDDWKGSNWAEFWKERLGDGYEKARFAPCTGLDAPSKCRACRPTYALYDGYDGDGRDAFASLLLEYRDEFEASAEEGETFVKYYGDGGFNSLGKSVRCVSFFLRQSEFGRFARIRRPMIVRAGNSGLYYDGMVLDGRWKEVFKPKDASQDDAKLPDGADELCENAFWKTFYAFDEMYVPKVNAVGSGQEGGSGQEDDEGNPSDFTFVGKYAGEFCDHESGTYWQRISYDVKMRLPLLVTRGVNDSYSWTLNGRVGEGGSVIDWSEDDEVFAERSGEGLSDALRKMLDRLFPESLFEVVKTEERDGETTVRFMSRKLDGIEKWRFEETSCGCARDFGLDFNERHAAVAKFNGSSCGLATFRQFMRGTGDGADAKCEFDVPMDGGFPIGEDGEENDSEPLFTCDAEHVNRHGCHFKYTARRFNASGRVYVRKYAVEQAYGAKDGSPMDGKDGRERGYCRFRIERVGKDEATGDELYRRVYDRKIGGIPPAAREITVSADGIETVEKGWWKGGTDTGDDSLCVTHSVDETGTWRRRSPVDAIVELSPVNVYHAEYVPFEEGWAKPFVSSGQGGHPVDRGQSARHAGNVAGGFVQYLMGAYAKPTSENVSVAKDQDEAYSVDAGFVSKVADEQGEGSRRYRENWGDEGGFGEKLGTVVAPFVLSPSARTLMVERWGYQPEKRVADYFKTDENMKDTYLPNGGSLVHGMTDDVALSGRIEQTVVTAKRLVSDKQRMTLPESEGLKSPYLDFRQAGVLPYGQELYFSSMPLQESESYAGRAVGPYPEDRPLRIRGEVDNVSVVSEWRMLYVQGEWNIYNLLHWEGPQDGSIGVVFEIAEVTDGVTGQFMPIRTKEGAWDEGKGAWVVPFVKDRLSVHVDATTGYFLKTGADGGIEKRFFEEGAHYRFRAWGVNVHTGEEAEPFYSAQFTYSEYAVAHPVVEDVEYDEWDGSFVITFRVDDPHGRDYDVVSVSYASYGDGERSPAEAKYVAIGERYLSGDLRGLESNLWGDKAVFASQVKFHVVKVAAEAVKAGQGELVRFSIEAEPSEFREGLTLPVFDFKMWANEFIHGAERTMVKVEGTTTRWKFVSETDEDGETVQKWEYLPKGQERTIAGTLHEKNSEIASIEGKFDEWYCGVALFEGDCFDARWHWLVDKGGGVEKIGKELAEEFARLPENAGAFSELKDGLPGKTDEYLYALFSERNAEEYGFYHANKAVRKVEVEGSYQTWLASHLFPSDEEVSSAFLSGDEGYVSWLDDNGLEDGHEARMAYVEEKSLTGEYEEFKRERTKYLDGRGRERIGIANSMRDEFDAWMQSPTDAFGEAFDEGEVSCEADAARQFLASRREYWALQGKENSGRDEAWADFMHVTVDGVSYGQVLQTAYAGIAEADRELSRAIDTRTRGETLFRRRAVAKGWFCNGWVDNAAFVGGIENEVFRYRVENQNCSGNSRGAGDVVEVGYSTRLDVYFRFQLDFARTFDSQDGKPLRDIYWQRKDCSDDAQSEPVVADGVEYVRIRGAIVAEGGMSVSSESGKYQAVTDGSTSPTTDEPFGFQLAGRYAIPHGELPGELNKDKVPYGWGISASGASSEFNHAYFWRVCPYNVLERPVWDSAVSTVSSPRRVASIESGSVWEISATAESFGGWGRCSWDTSDLTGRGDYAPYLWVRGGELESERWVVPSMSQTVNRNEAWRTEFFKTIPDGLGGYETADSQEREAYSYRLERGEVVFLTDKPTKAEDGKLVEAMDSNRHLRIRWTQPSLERAKPWVARGGGKWWLACQKRNGDGWTLSMSLGLSVQTFGEVGQAFPVCVLDSPSDVVDGAVSFESPCLAKDGDTWEIYFTARFKDGGTETWKAKSKDMMDWEGFERVMFDDDVSDVAVYRSPDALEAYAVVETDGTWELRRYAWKDGAFQWEGETVVASRERIERPTKAGGKIWFGEAGKVYSAAYGELSEESLPTPTDSYGEGASHADPFVWEDTEMGTPVVRCVCVAAMRPFVYSNDGVLLPSQAMETPALMTALLETHSWGKASLAKGAERNTSVIRTGEAELNVVEAGDGTPINAFRHGQDFPADGFVCRFVHDGEAESVRIPLYISQGRAEITAEGEWIWNGNVGETEAELVPEFTEREGNGATVEWFLHDTGEYGEYEAWAEANGKEISEETMEAYVKHMGKWSLYVKTAFGGMGIYRHVPSVGRMDYWGNGKKN